MRRSNRRSACLLEATGVAVWADSCTSVRQKINAEESRATGRPPRIRPDYANTVIPPNIAPLNFVVEEPASRYQVRIYAPRGDTIEIHTEEPGITIPIGPWSRLLHDNRGNQLHIRIHTKNTQGTWLAFNAATITIANEDVDSHIAYRLMRPQYNFYRELGVYQRNLQTYDESLVFHGP